MDDQRLAENLKKRDEILKILEERRASYGCAAVKTALSKADGIWKNVLTRIELLHRDEERPVGKKYAYKDFCLSSVVLELNQFIELIDTLVNKENLAILNLPVVSVEGRFQSEDWMRFIPSNDKVFSLEWSTRGFDFHAINTCKGNLPSGPFVSSDLPLFPDGHIAINKIIGLNISRYHQFHGSILIFLPNYQAKIRQLKVASKHLILTISCKEIPKDKIIGKIFMGQELGTRIEQLDVAFDKESKIIPVNFKLGHLHVAILESDCGDIIDERRFHVSWRELPSDVYFEISEEEIETLIMRGENEVVEFKQDLPKNTEAIAKTAVAFANTFGGTIFLGVTDNAEIVGFSDPKGEERVRNILRTHCEPPINPSIEIKQLQDKPILLVRIEEGKNKPYTMREKGPFVRYGSTDRAATKYELDEFYKKA